MSAAPDTRESHLRELLADHAPTVFAYARRRGASPAQAADVVSETFLVAWRRLGAIPAESELPWLLGVARNVLRNTARGDRRRAALEARAIEVGAWVSDDHCGVVGKADAIRTAFASISASDREVLALIAWEGLTGAEAARVVGCRAGTFAVRLHRARRRLARALADTDRKLGQVDMPPGMVPAAEETT